MTIETAIRIPDTLGPYRVDELLGRGGMGEVFKCFDRSLERPVAIKRIRTNLDDIEPLTRFQREAKAVARLNHQAIVQVYELLQTDHGHCIVMEYVDGRPISSLLVQGPLPQRRAVRLALDIAEGLAEAHGKGLLHRDLKSDNVLVSETGQAKILDFGLALLLDGETYDRLTASGVLLGTAHTMAPELITGHEIDHRADLFSLGVMIYEMLAGETPFQGPTVLESLRRVVCEPPPDLSEKSPDLSADLEDLVDRLLAKAPESRPNGADEVVTALRRILGALGDADDFDPLPAPSDTVPPIAPTQAIDAPDGDHFRADDHFQAGDPVQDGDQVPDGNLSDDPTVAETSTEETHAPVAPPQTPPGTAWEVKNLRRQRNLALTSLLICIGLALFLGQEYVSSQDVAAPDTVVQPAGADPLSRARFMASTGHWLESEGQLAEAEAAVRASLALLRSLPEPPPEDLEKIFGDLERILRKQGQNEGADAVLEELRVLSLENPTPSP